MTDVVEKIARELCLKRKVDPDELHDFGNGQLAAWALVAEEVEWTIDALAESVTPNMCLACIDLWPDVRDLPGDKGIAAGIRAAILAAKG